MNFRPARSTAILIQLYTATWRTFKNRPIEWSQWRNVSAVYCRNGYIFFTPQPIFLTLMHTAAAIGLVDLGMERLDATMRVLVGD